MDFSKAFDYVNHELLVAKLHAFGFSRSTCNILYVYLCMICIVYVKLSRLVCNIDNRKYCLYNVLLLSRVHLYPVVMILVKCKRSRRLI